MDFILSHLFGFQIFTGLKENVEKAERHLQDVRTRAQTARQLYGDLQGLVEIQEALPDEKEDGPDAWLRELRPLETADDDTGPLDVPEAEKMDFVRNPEHRAKLLAWLDKQSREEEVDLSRVVATTSSPGQVSESTVQQQLGPTIPVRHTPQFKTTPEELPITPTVSDAIDSPADIYRKFSAPTQQAATAQDVAPSIPAPLATQAFLPCVVERADLVASETHVNPSGVQPQPAKKKSLFMEAHMQRHR